LGWGNFFYTRLKQEITASLKIFSAGIIACMSLKKQEHAQSSLETMAKAHLKIREEVFKIEVEVLSEGKLPTKAHPSDAGWDLYATSDIALYPGQVIKHPLNIKLKLPKNSWAEITTKSGLGSKGQLVYAGVIDEAYRGVPHVVMTNVKHRLENGSVNTEPLIIRAGEKVAQLIMNPYSSSFFVEKVEKVINDTDRGSGGFGSSGK
jgi:dUTP pyrophosphatase